MDEPDDILAVAKATPSPPKGAGTEDVDTSSVVLREDSATRLRRGSKLRRSTKLSPADMQKLAAIALHADPDELALLEQDSPELSPQTPPPEASMASDAAADEKPGVTRLPSFKSLEEVRKVREKLDVSNSHGQGGKRASSPRRNYDSNSPRKKFHDTNSPRRPSPRVSSPRTGSPRLIRYDSGGARRWASSPHTSPMTSPRVEARRGSTPAEPNADVVVKKGKNKRRKGRSRKRSKISVTSSEDEELSRSPVSSPRISEKYGPLTDSNEMKWNLQHLDDLEVVSSLRDDRAFMESWERLQGNYRKTLVGQTTSLHMAAAYNNWSAIELLLANGSDINGQDSDGWTPLMYAVSRSSYRTAQLLLNIGADTMATNSHGDTVLHLLASRPPMDVVEQQEWQRLFATILMCYSKQVQAHGKVQSIRDLRKSSVDEGLIQELMSLPGDDDNTPLHKAVLSSASNLDILFVVNILISWGADREATNRHGLTPGALARRLRHHSLAHILELSETPERFSAEVLRVAVSEAPTQKGARVSRSSSTSPMRRTDSPPSLGVFRCASSLATVPSSSVTSPVSARKGEPTFSPMLLFLVPQSRQDWVFAYDAFSLEKKSSSLIRLSANLFHRLRQVDCLICPCYSTLGPCYPQYSLSADVISHIGAEFQEQLDDYMREHFYGEAPIGTIFMLRAPSTAGRNSVYVLFIVLGDASYEDFGKTYAYNGLRSALLYIREHNLKAVADENGGEKVISKIICPLFDPLGEVAAMPSPSRIIAHQMALAYRNAPTTFPTLPGAVDPCTYRGGAFAEKLPASARKQRAEACIPAMPDSVEQEQRLITVAMRGELRSRGLGNEEELKWLLKAVADAKAEPIQRAACQELFALLHSWKKISPTDVQKEAVLAQMTSHKAAMDSIMRMAGTGQISFSIEVPYEHLEIIEVIGRGASAVVHKAIFRKQEVAVKVFREGIDPVEFRQEVVLMSMLESQFLVKMIGIGFVDRYQDQPFIVTELMKMSLFDLLHREKKELSMQQSLTLALHATKGVHYLHSMGFIHRDIKSLNLLVDAKGLVKVTDFGTSRLVENSRKNMTLNVGTCAWMAPEVMTSTKYSEKADIFSLGMVFYEIFCRRLPYEDVEQHMIARLIERGTKPVMPKGVPKPLTKLIKECWYDKPAKRPNAARLIVTLEALKQTLR